MTDEQHEATDVKLVGVNQSMSTQASLLRTFSNLLSSYASITQIQQQIQVQFPQL